MKVVYIVITLVVIAAVASGAYIWWATISQPERRAPGTQPAQVVSVEALEKLKGQTESQFRDLKSRIEGLEILIGRLEKETAALRGSLGGAAVKSPEVAPPAQQENPTRDPLREDVRRAVDEPMKERQERMYEENQRRFIEITQRRLERSVERFGWDEQKKQSVMAIVAEHEQDVRKLLEAARDEGATGAEARDALIEKIRQVSSGTMDKLRVILTPEEAQEVERVINPSRRFRGPGPELPPSGEGTPPVQPEPGSGQ